LVVRSVTKSTHRQRGVKKRNLGGVDSVLRRVRAAEQQCRDEMNYRKRGSVDKLGKGASKGFMGVQYLESVSQKTNEEGDRSVKDISTEQGSKRRIHSAVASRSKLAIHWGISGKEKCQMCKAVGEGSKLHERETEEEWNKLLVRTNRLRNTKNRSHPWGGTRVESGNVAK